MNRAPDFRSRLAYARKLLARGEPSMPLHLADQFASAATDALAIHDTLGAVLPLIEPERGWHHRIDANPSDTVRSYLVAALFGSTTVCSHLKHGGPQPAVVRLPLRRVDCSKCVQTLRRPPVGEDDRCDVCGARNVVTFVPLACRQGPVLIVGDACPDCADMLGIRTEVSA